MNLVAICRLVGCMAGFATASASLTFGQDSQLPNRHNQNSAGDVIAADTGKLNGPGPLPWFAHPAIRDELQLNEEAFTQLYQTYEQSWTALQQALQSTGRNLTGFQREQQIQQISGAYQKRIDRGVNSILIDPTEKLRFNQLYTQYRGYGAFNDPTIQQKINLSERQIELFNQYGREWRADLGEWVAEYNVDPRAVTAMLNEAREEFFSRVDSILTTEQHRIWQSMIGEPFAFPAGVYFSGEAVATVAEQSSPDAGELLAELPDL